MHVHEVAVVGAGPIGLELAVALKKHGVDYVQFDAKQIGHTISWYAPQTKFFSSNERIAIANVPLLTPDQSKATREDYLMYLRGVVELYDLDIRTYEPVKTIDRVGDFFEIKTTTAAGEQVTRARRVVLATGGTDHPRRLDVPGEDLPHVSHYFDDPHKYFHKKVLVVGGKNSAVEAALRCHHAGGRVSLSYRRAGLPERHIKYWLMPEMNGLIKSGRLPGYFETTVKSISPTHVTLERTGGEAFDVAADFVLLLVGYLQDNTLLKQAGVTLDGPCGLPRFSHETMETDVEGIFVIGTAVGGTQDKYSVFIENCHVHVERVMKALFGIDVKTAKLDVTMAES